MPELNIFKLMRESGSNRLSFELEDDIQVHFVRLPQETILSDELAEEIRKTRDLLHKALENSSENGED